VDLQKWGTTIEGLLMRSQKTCRVLSGKRQRDARQRKVKKREKAKLKTKPGFGLTDQNTWELQYGSRHDAERKKRGVFHTGGGSGGM